ncbi:hypothetical protein KTC41_02660 [Vibrio cholerae]|nr:hypothetical protein KTC41_02660 [Vibrio cholerae]
MHQLLSLSPHSTSLVNGTTICVCGILLHTGKAIASGPHHTPCHVENQRKLIHIPQDKSAT